MYPVAPYCVKPPSTVSSILVELTIVVWLYACDSKLESFTAFRCDLCCMLVSTFRIGLGMVSEEGIPGPRMINW